MEAGTEGATRNDERRLSQHGLTAPSAVQFGVRVVGMAFGTVRAATLARRHRLFVSVAA